VKKATRDHDTKLFAVRDAARPADDGDQDEAEPDGFDDDVTEDLDDEANDLDELAA
jgi:hypothetical protein